MMRTLPETYKSRWHFHVNKLVHAYNCSPNDVTGYSPFQLMFGRPPRLPIDVMFSAATPEDKREYSAYVEEWKQATAEAHEKAQERTGKSALQSKKRYDQAKPTSLSLEKGDHVLVRNGWERGGPGKLRSYWENRVYEVLERIAEDSPVYKVRVEGSDGEVCVLHRNMLYPCPYLAVTTDRGKPKKTKRLWNRRRTQEKVDRINEESDDELDIEAITIETTREPQNKDELLDKTPDIGETDENERIREGPVTQVEEEVLQQNEE